MSNLKIFIFILITVFILGITIIGFFSVILDWSERDIYSASSNFTNMIPVILGVIAVFFFLFISVKTEDFINIQTSSGEIIKAHLSIDYKVKTAERMANNCGSLKDLYIDIEDAINDISSEKEKKEIIRKSFEREVLHEIKHIGNQYCIDIKQVKLDF